MGVSVGLVYALSPLSIVFVIVIALVIAWAGRGLPSDERNCITALLLAAVLARVLAVALLFLFTDHSRVPFGSLFGDEEYFIKRSIWLRNVALGIPIHAADLIYAFDEYSQTSYLYVLAFIQVLVGPSPYGVHLLGIAFYVMGTIVLFRAVRPAFGRYAAAAGLILLLALPTLFAWSVSALKDPLFFLFTAMTVPLGLTIARSPTWTGKAAAVAASMAVVAAIETIRPANGVIVAAGLVGGLVISGVARRPRLLLAVMVLAPIMAGAVLRLPAAQHRAYGAVQMAARQHWGHVATAGYTYRLLDDRLYPDRSSIDDLHFGESMRFVVRAVVSYATVPAPWEVQSRSALAYLPEQLIWYALIVLAPFGVGYGMRRDSVLTGLLVGNAAVFAISVAVTSGNVGTLVRHRGLALPFLVWLSTIGACDLLSGRLAAARDRLVTPLPRSVMP
jgi:hypothetical protein